MGFLESLQELLSNHAFLLGLIAIEGAIIAKRMDNIVDRLFEIQDNTNNLN